MNVGDKYNTKEGYTMEIISRNKRKVIVRFLETGNTKEIYINRLNDGKVKNPYHPSVYGVGFLGEGVYKAHDKNLVKTEAYKCWSSMIMRCYCEKFKSKQPHYIGVAVDKEWHNFQNFAEWFYKNKPNNTNIEYELDKDILSRDEKIYSPSTCIFLPKEINRMISNLSTITNVSMDKQGKYRLYVFSEYKGIYDTLEECASKKQEILKDKIQYLIKKYNYNEKDIVYEYLNNYII